MSDQQHTGETSSFNDESLAQSDAAQVQAQAPSPGTVLAAERQAKGWSVEYVASHLKLAIRQIHALEEDRYDALPSPVVIRGFIRIYAKMLGIDSAGLVAALPISKAPVDVQVRPSRTLSTPFSESSLPLRGRHELPLARIAWLVFGVLVIAALFSAMKYGNWDEVKNSSLMQRMHGSAASAPVIASPGSDASDAGSAPAAVADSDKNTVPSEVASSAPLTPAVSDAVPAAAAVSSAPGAAAAPSAPVPVIAANNAAPAVAVNAAPAASAATPAVATGANPLQLTVHQDSWVEIRRADKTTMVSAILKAGTTQAFDISQPVSMVVGNAAGVDATLRGKPLELTTTNNNNVARLDLK